MKSKRIILILFLSGLACLSSGCATYTLPKPVFLIQSPKVDFKELKKLYISRDDEADAQGERTLRVFRAVQEALAGQGIPTTYGLLSAMPSDTECKVLINDKWWWDMDWYLLSLDIKFYDARSGKLLAFGYTRRAHPTIRRSPEFMTNELIDAIFPASSEANKL